MEEKLRQLLMEIIYNELDLSKYESILEKEEIVPKEIYNPDNLRICSQYFFILNDIYLQNLQQEEQEYLKKKIANFDELSDEGKKEVYEFLSKRKKDLLCPNMPITYLYYGGYGFENMAPSDSIVLAFHYQKDYSLDDDLLTKKESVVVNIANKIQKDCYSEKNTKVSVILFDSPLYKKSRQ